MLAAPLDAAFEHVADAQFLRHHPHIGRAAFVGKARAPRDYGKTSEPAQRRDEVLDDTVGEVVLLGVTAEIAERQHHDRGPAKSGGRGLALSRQAVAHARHRGDPLPPLCILPQRLAQCRDLDGEVHLLDDCPWPCALEESRLPHRLPTRLE